MERILLAVGFRQLEEYLEKKLKKEYIFVGTTVYREGIIRAIGQKNPDIVIVRETLEGNENILSIVYEVRTRYPKVRIIFLAGKREPGDALLHTLVSYGIYDILYGNHINASDVIALIRKPNEYKDIKHLQPVPVLDEKKNKVIFKSPKPETVVKEIIREIPGSDGENPQNEDEVIIHDVPLTEVDNTSSSKEDKKIDIKNQINKKFDFFKFKDDQANKISAGMITKQKIITFLGSKDGVGNSTIALNMALLLAKRGMKTIFIELDEKTPSVSYWYELGFLEDGIDSAINALIDEDYEKIDEAIVRTKDLKKKETLMQKNYKKFPDKLDFMFFSNKYLTREESEELREPLDLEYTKELFLYLIFQHDYDYVILDVPSNISHDITKNALLYSNKIFLTVTQDVSTIGYALYKVNELIKKGMKLDKKLYYIVNKYEKSKLLIKEIQDWIESKDCFTVPCDNKECINSNFIGLPLALYTKNSVIRSSLEKIEKIII